MRLEKRLKFYCEETDNKEGKIFLAPRMFLPKARSVPEGIMGSSRKLSGDIEEKETTEDYMHISMACLFECSLVN